jgi:hypothetical protein
MFQKPPMELRRGFKDKSHRDKVGALDCIACKIRNERQESPTEVHHKWGTGAGQKESDKLTFGLCNKCHTGSFRGAMKGISLHENLKAFEDRHKTQLELIEMTYLELGLEDEWLVIDGYFNNK